MKQAVVNRKDIEELYGEKLPLLDRTFGNGGLLSVPAITEEMLPVQIAADQGPFQIIKPLHTLQDRNGNGPIFIMPKGKVQTVDYPSCKDAYTPILNKLFGENWCQDNNGILVKYPEITIKNAMGMTHTIRDMFVYVSIANYQLLDSHLQGQRITFSRKETAVGYTHSHLNPSSYDHIEVFCLGSSNLNTYLTNMTQSRRHILPSELEILFMQIKAYLEWESLEGIPYISIKELASRRLQEIVGGATLPVTVNAGGFPIDLTWYLFVLNATEDLLDKGLIDFTQNNGAIISPYASPDKRLAWELEVTERYLRPNISSEEYETITQPYDTANGSYFVEGRRNSRNDDTIIEQADEFIAWINARFRLQPTHPFANLKGSVEDAFISQEAATNSVVRRLNTTGVIKLYSGITSILLHSFNQQLNESNNGEAQSEIAHYTEPSSSSVSAPQPVPVEE